MTAGKLCRRARARARSATIRTVLKAVCCVMFAVRNVASRELCARGLRLLLIPQTAPHPWHASHHPTTRLRPAFGNHESRYNHCGTRPSTPKILPKPPKSPEAQNLRKRRPFPPSGGEVGGPRPPQPVGGGGAPKTAHPSFSLPPPLPAGGGRGRSPRKEPVGQFKPPQTRRPGTLPTCGAAAHRKDPECPPRSDTTGFEAVQYSGQRHLNPISLGRGRGLESPRVGLAFNAVSRKIRGLPRPFVGLGTRDNPCFLLPFSFSSIPTARALLLSSSVKLE